MPEWSQVRGAARVTQRSGFCVAADLSARLEAVPPAEDARGEWSLGLRGARPQCCMGLKGIAEQQPLRSEFVLTVPLFKINLLNSF